LYGVGFPQLKAEFHYDLAKKEVNITLEQTQCNKEKQIGAFDISLDVVLIDENGKSYNKVLRFEGTRGSLVFVVDAKVSQVLIDPENKVLFSIDFNPGQDILENVLTHGQNIFSRIWAAKELIKMGNLSNFNFVEKAMSTEKFYGVKIAVSEALASAKSTNAVQVLIHMLSPKEHANVQAKIALLLKGFRSGSVEKALVEYLKGKDLPYRGEGWALEALGTFGMQHFEFLKSKADDNGFLGHVRGGALRGIGNLKSREAYLFLKERVKYGEKEESRPSAIQAFAEVANWVGENERKEAEQIIIEIMLRDPEYGIQRNIFASARALAKLHFSSSIGALEAAKQRISHQEYKTIDNAINDIKNANKKDAKNPLQKDVEQLQKKVQELEEKLSQK